MHDEREAHDGRDDAPGGEAAAEIARLGERLEGSGAGRAFPALAEAYRRDGRPTDAERVAREGLRRVPSMLAGRVALGLALLDQGRTEDARAELERVLDQVPDHALARDVLAREQRTDSSQVSPDLEALPNCHPSTLGDAPERVVPADAPLVASTPPAPAAVAAAPNRLEFDRSAPEPEPQPQPESVGGLDAIDEADTDSVFAVAATAPEPAPEESFDAIDEDEIDSAFAAAEPERDQLVDADRIAQQAIESLQETPLDQPAEETPAVGTSDEVPLIAEGSPLATRTMADLLERQGHTHEAESMRRAAAGREHSASLLPESDEKDEELARAPAAPPRAARPTRIETLNRWLRNARRRQG